MQPARRLGARAVLGGHGTQLKQGELETGVTEDFLVVRTAGLDNSLPREGARELHFPQDTKGTN